MSGIQQRKTGSHVHTHDENPHKHTQTHTPRIHSKEQAAVAPFRRLCYLTPESSGGLPPKPQYRCRRSSWETAKARPKLAVMSSPRHLRLRSRRRRERRRQVLQSLLGRRRRCVLVCVGVCFVSLFAAVRIGVYVSGTSRCVLMCVSCHVRRYPAGLILRT